MTSSLHSKFSDPNDGTSMISKWKKMPLLLTTSEQHQLSGGKIFFFAALFLPRNSEIHNGSYWEILVVLWFYLLRFVCALVFNFLLNSTQNVKQCISLACRHIEQEKRAMRWGITS